MRTQASVQEAPPGTYAHRVLAADLRHVCGVDADELAPVAAHGGGWAAPAWVSVTFSHLLERPEVDYLVRAVMEVGHNGWRLLPQYSLHCATGAPPVATRTANLAWVCSSIPAREAACAASHPPLAGGALQPCELATGSVALINPFF